MLRILFALLIFPLLTACTDDDLPKYIELRGLRILALSSDTVAASGAAEYSPGDSVRITPWVSDFDATRTINYSWQACVDPGITVGVDPSCDGVSGATAVTTAALTIPATERTGSGNTFDVTIPSDILDNRSALEQFNGVNYLVTYELVASDGASVKSFKRLITTSASKPVKNQNPTFNDILAGNSSFTVFPSDEVALRASYPASSIESYTSLRSDGSVETRNEDLVTTWFITDGELDLYRTINDGETNYDPVTSRPTDHTPLVLGIMRDGRGGVAALLRSGL